MGQVSVGESVLSKPSKPKTIHLLLCLAMLLALFGAGSAPSARASGQLTLTPNSLDFGCVWLGRTHALSVTIANTGNAAVTLSGQTVTGSGYSVQGLRLPLNLGAGKTATFSVRFTPQSAGVSAGTLKLISNAANATLAVTLSGSGASRNAGYVTASPLATQFGNVPVGTKNTQNVQVTNTGSRGVSISSVAATGRGFSVSGITTPYSLPAGASAQFTVAFQPADAGNASGAVTIASTASDSAVSIAVSGTGTPTTRLLSVSPGSVAFGNVTAGTSAAQTLTLTNTGNSSLTISSDAASGAGMSVTGVAGGTTLAPGQSATLTVGFAPKTAGNVTGSITIASDATNAPSMSLPLSGSGVLPASHYNVYRGTTAGGPYTKMDSAAISSTSYADSSVTSGTTYYYAVTALGTDGLESGYSNQVTAVIP